MRRPKTTFGALTACDLAGDSTRPSSARGEVERLKRNVRAQQDSSAIFARVHLAKGQSIPPLDVVRRFYDEHDHAADAMLTEITDAREHQPHEGLPHGLRDGADKLLAEKGVG